jgi:hemerythrin superfamily protein
MKATRILVAQHRAIEALFEELAGETRRHARARMASRLAEELIAHMAGEEAIFFPAVKRELGDSRVSGDIGGPDNEHFMLRAQLRRVLATNVHGPAFQPRFEALRLLFEHHVQAEETELFPRVESALTEAQLERLGAEVLGARPPIWVVTTEGHALVRSNKSGGVCGVRLPSVR